jgi:hypothetical protein
MRTTSCFVIFTLVLAVSAAKAEPLSPAGDNRRLIIQTYINPTIQATSGNSYWVDSCVNSYGVVSCSQSSHDQAALAFCQRQGAYDWHQWTQRCEGGHHDTFRYREYVINGQVVKDWEFCAGCTCHFTQLLCRFNVNP